MSNNRSRRLHGRGAALTVSVTLLITTLQGCTSPASMPVRIGVLAECVGFFRNLRDAGLAGAEIPLLERGAALNGQRPSDGVTPTTIAGRPVELVAGCTEGGEYSTLIEQTRVLIEDHQVDVVIGGTWAGDGLILRELARKYQDTTFVVSTSGPREVTLGDTAPNLFRFAPDISQQVAGLGTFAFRDLGWRNAVVVAENDESGWGGAAAFLAEFCALGGRVTQYPMSVDLQPPTATGADGLALFSTPFGPPAETLAGFAADPASPSTSLVLGPGVSADADYLHAVPESLSGVVTVVPAPDAPDAGERYRAAMARYFPSAPVTGAMSAYVVQVHDAAEAVMLALEATAGVGGAALREALGSIDADLVGGRVRVDANRAVIVSTALARLGPGGTESIIRAVPAVDQTFGGALPAGYEPRFGEQPCGPGIAAPWAR
jgi:branched-chain amino acid transport system substrate-binding protein